MFACVLSLEYDLHEDGESSFWLSDGPPALKTILKGSQYMLNELIHLFLI